MSDDSNSQKDRAESNGLGSIGQELASFVTQIEALNTSLPLVMTMMQAANDSERKHFKKFLETNGELLEEQGKEKVYRFEINHVHELRRRERKLERVVVGRKILPRSFVVSLVSQFDFFVGRLLRALYELRPELLNALERQLSFAELVSFGSLERAKEYVLEKEVETLLRKSHPEQFGWLENKFSVPLRKDLPIWPTFVELTERRNLFVHCNGIVSSQYLEECRSHNVVFERQPQLGEELGVTPEYYRLAYRCIFEIGVKLAQVLWRKIVPDDLERADFSLVDVTYDLLQQEQYELAAALLDLQRTH